VSMRSCEEKVAETTQQLIRGHKKQST